MKKLTVLMLVILTVFMFSCGACSKQSVDKTAKREAVQVSKNTDKVYNNFSIEMANGENIDAPTINRLNTSLKTIDEDNFFLILKKENGFLQTAISEKGFIVQYSEGKGLFETTSYFTMEKLTEIFGAYLKAENWKAMGEWQIVKRMGS